MRYPRLGTPAGNSAFSSAQRAYDNLTPEDVYGPDDDEPEPEDEQELEPIMDFRGNVVGYRKGSE